MRARLASARGLGLPALATLATSAALATLAGCHPQPVGEILLVVQTDLSLPKDIDTIRIEADNGGVTKFLKDYEALGTSNGTLPLPATLGLLAPSNPSDAISITVSGFSGGSGVGGTLLLQREAVTTVPPGDIVTLEMPLDFLCYGQAKLVGSTAESSCASGQTCIAGTCTSDTVDSSKLQTYASSQIDPGGSCFDGVTCWTHPTVATVDKSTCSLAKPAEPVNVALQTTGAGICGPAGCFVTLDADDAEGWTVGANGTIDLPPAVCKQLEAGTVVNVVTEPISAACNGKNLALPTCGTWSGATKEPPPYVGPLVLAGGQPRPVALALLSGELYWTNGGVGTATGSLASVGPSGGTPKGVPTAGQDPRALVSDGGAALFWTDSPGTAKQGSVYRAYGSSVTQIVTKLDAPEGIAFASPKGGSLIFWTDFEDGTISMAGANNGSDVTQIAAGQSYPYRIAADDNYVYWTNEGTLDKKDGSVARVQYTNPKAATELLAPAQETPRAIALDVENGVTVAVYWADFAPSPAGTVYRVAISGGTPGSPEIIASGLDYPNGLAVDAGDAGLLYWTNRGDGTLMSIALGPSPGKPKTLVTGQHAPGSLTVDATNVYWLNEGSSSAESGAIIKLPKGT